MFASSTKNGSLIVLLFLAAANTVTTRATLVDPPATWEDGTTFSLGSRSVILSKPRLVGRRNSHLWFPTLLQFGAKDFAAVMSHSDDAAAEHPTSLVSRSKDGGLTWSSPEERQPYGECALSLNIGEVVLLPFNLHFQSETSLTGAYQVWRADHSVSTPVQDGIVVTGWPRKLGPLDADLGGKPQWNLGSFFFNGQTVSVESEKVHLAMLYGRFAGTKRYSLVVAESADAKAWKIRSIVADEKCALPGADGPSESAIVRLKDGRLCCVFRMSSGAPYGESFSADDGRTWSTPVAMEGPHSVQPSLAVSTAGTVALSGGRPDLVVWMNFTGDARTWQPIDLAANHNAAVKTDTILKSDVSVESNTTAYTEVRWLDDSHFLVIYDRLSSGWRAPAAGSGETNSVWVVRGTVR